jgi:hypothetical protein
VGLHPTDRPPAGFDPAERALRDPEHTRQLGLAEPRERARRANAGRLSWMLLLVRFVMMFSVC